MPLSSVTPKWLSRAEPLSRHSSLKIGGPADYFARPESHEDLYEALAFAAAEKIPWLIVGGGSNTLFDDAGYRGLVIKLDRMASKISNIRRSGDIIRVPAGVSIPHLGHFCRAQGLSGVEFLSQIPGTVGGAVIMNAGFSRVGNRSQSVGPLVQKVTLLTSEGQTETWAKDRLQFSYRGSNLSGVILLDIVLALTQADPDLVAREMRLNYEYRVMHQDLRYPSAGSVFKNPDGTPLTAGQLIDRLALKGKRIGDAQISELHGNWISNRGHARSSDVRALIELIRSEVEKYYGVLLETEIRVVDHGGM